MGTAQAAGTVFDPRWESRRASRFSRLRWTWATLAVAVPPLLALAVFLAHSFAFRGWLVDDAGISFAYARSLAEGHGLVAQPGATPVEGFSNPLWTLLLAALFAMGAFDPAWTPKALSVALVAATFGVVAWGRIRSGGARSAAAAVTLLLLSLNAGFVIWTSSGLENPLLAFLAALSCVVASAALDPSRRLEAAAGVVAALLALTRPDAVVYAAAFPLLLASTRGASGAAARPTIASHARFALGFLPPWGGYLLFRRLYFGDWLPNTYHAKEHPSLLSLVDAAKLTDLLRAAAGRMALPAMALLFLGGGWAIAAGRAPARLRSVLVHLALAAVAYLVMPVDWMGEHRFATPFFLFFAWSLAEVGLVLVESAGRFRRMAAVGAAAVAAVLVIETALVSVPRSSAFAASPIVPFAKVESFGADGYNRLAQILGVAGASLMTPDVGGTLFGSTLRVYDLVGLCDPVAARTLTHDTAAFRDYVFATARPTFIHVHGAWAQWAALKADPRLDRDYAPLWEVWPSDGGSEPWSADYVRRDALARTGDPMRLEALRRAFVAMGLHRLNP